MENFTTAGVFNLLSNFVLHGKSHRLPAFYGCSTFDFKNIRKVICGDLKITSWFVATQYAKCQIPAKKRHGQSQLCSHREHAISTCCVLRLSVVVFNTRVRFFIPAGPYCLFFSLHFPPEPRVQVSCHGRGWEKNRQRQRQRWTARAIPLWNINGSLVL